MIIIDEHTLNEFRRKRRCEYCNRPTTRCDPAHVFARGLGGGHRLDIRINLVALCRICHSMHHSGKRPGRDDLLTLVASREGTSRGSVVSEILRLKRLPKDSCRRCERRQWMCECLDGTGPEINALRGEPPF